MDVNGLDKPFIVVGENVHCTRVLLRKGNRIGNGPDGDESLLWTDSCGTSRSFRISEQAKKSNDFQEGRVKHVQLAVKAAMGGGDDADDGMDYIRHVVDRQVEAGVDFLDINTDEISYKHEEQQEAMDWLVRTVQSITSVPLSIDSSLMETIAAGMRAYDATKGRPLLNSASLERADTLDLAVEHNAYVVITAAGASGMPQNEVERVDHASQMIDRAVAKGMAIQDIQVDLLVFPISVDSAFGLHYLEAVRQIRDKYGSEIHITGGMSNVSFGIPARRLVNDVFVNLAIEHGADAGIIDPVTRNIENIVTLDKTTQPYDLARKMLLGEDLNCKQFLRAYRKGELKI